MRRRTSLIILPLTVMGLVTLFILTITEIKAQINAFTYFIPIMTDDLNDMYDAATADETVTRDLTPGTQRCGELGVGGMSISDENMVETIVIAVERDNTVIYYDHWEDNYETNLTTPTQPMTQIWGDGNPANGIRPGAPVGDPDILTAGTSIILQNLVPVPRSAATFLFDGGDKLTATGGYLSVTRSAWPECSGAFFAGAWELYPTLRWGNDYVVPVGEGLPFQGFSTVDLNIQAVVNDTVVQFDLNGDGAFTGAAPDIPDVTLDQGQNQSVNVPTVSAGARVRTTSPISPVQVQILTGDANGTPPGYEARAYSLVPSNQLSNDYVAPRSSDFGQYWLHNHNGTAIVVTPTTNAGPQAPLNIPANSTISYNPGGATGVRFQSSDNFYGVVTLDDAFRQDWGYGLQPIDNLTSQVLVGWGVGDTQNPPTANHSRVYVSAVTSTTLFVDYNSDGITDTTVFIAPFNEVQIVDTDFDMSGATIFSLNDQPFVSVWGQDQAAPGGGTAMDVGTNVVPVPGLKLMKSITLTTDADNSGTITWGDTVQFSLAVFNDSPVILNPTSLTDNLPASVVYVSNSSQIRGVTISDDGSGTPFPFDGAGATVPSGLAAREKITATFQAIVQEGNDDITNSATASSPALLPATDTVSVPLRVARYELGKRLISPANGEVSAGGTAVFGLTITSTGNISITKLTLSDKFDSTYVTFSSAITSSPDITTSGQITWTDIVALYGPLDPNDRVDITTTFQVVNPLPANVPGTTNTASTSGVEGSDGAPVPALNAQAQLTFPSPTPLPTLTPTPTPTPLPAPPDAPGNRGDDDDDDDGSAPAPPTPTPTPAALAAANPPGSPADNPTPTLPVALLPETGVTGGVQGVGIGLLLTLVVTLTTFILILGASLKKGHTS